MRFLCHPEGNGPFQIFLFPDNKHFHLTALRFENRCKAARQAVGRPVQGNHHGHQAPFALPFPSGPGFGHGDIRFPTIWKSRKDRPARLAFTDCFFIFLYFLSMDPVRVAEFSNASPRRPPHFRALCLGKGHRLLEGFQERARILVVEDKARHPVFDHFGLPSARAANREPAQGHVLQYRVWEVFLQGRMELGHGSLRPPLNLQPGKPPVENELLVFDGFREFLFDNPPDCITPVIEVNVVPKVMKGMPVPPFPGFSPSGEPNAKLPSSIRPGKPCKSGLS